MSDISSGGDELFKSIISGDFDGSEFNPNFDTSSAIPEDFETIDIWPINNTKINSPFGPRNIGRGASKNHGGVDLNAKVGTPIYSPANGVVKAARDTTPNACGGFVKINHGKYTTKYCHLIKFDVVKKGDSLSSIADQFDVPLAAIIIWNSLDPKAPIHPGDRLMIHKKKQRSIEIHRDEDDSKASFSGKN